MSREEVNAILRQFQFEDLDMASRSATHWLQEHLSTVGQLRRDRILTDAEPASSINPGNIYFFSYNPLTKNNLPFYDMFPVTFCLQLEKGGFLGLNLHYLRPYNRAVFLNFLIDYADRTEWNTADISKILIDYTAAVKKIKNKGDWVAKALKASIKKYYFKQFLSGSVRVPPKDWKIVPFLPLDRFVKATREEVYTWASGV